jgi:glycerophosphoryl diester phosphodiesterase
VFPGLRSAFRRRPPLPAAPDLPRVIGHRGAAAHAPENTLIGLRKAARLGARWVEFDVRLTRDRRLVLLHDDTLDRTTDGRGAAAALNLAEIQRFDAGAKFGRAFTAEPVPSLDDAIDVLAELGLGANIEMKCAPREAGATARTLAAALAELWPERLPPPLVSSFEPAALAAFKDAAPRWPRGLLVKEFDKDTAARLRDLGAATLHLGEQGLDAPSVKKAATLGRPLVVYTVNDPARARDLWRWGVAAIISDRPDALLAASAGKAA